MSAINIVEATERLYRSLFTAATLYAVGMAAWGMVIAPFNGFRADHAASIALGGLLVAVGSVAFHYRLRLFEALRRNQRWLLLVAVVGVAALWTDGGWRSSYYLASYSAVAFAAVTGGIRWSLACGGVLAAGYVTGLALHGYSWEELRALKDADSVVANTAGYLIAAYFFAAPVEWLGRYVGRINQVVAAPGATRPATAAPSRCAGLTARELEVLQLVVAGCTDPEIAEKLFVSPRTVHSHVGALLRKTEARNRTELAALAVAEGLAGPADAHAQPVPAEALQDR